MGYHQYCNLIQTYTQKNILSNSWFPPPVDREVLFSSSQVCFCLFPLFVPLPSVLPDVNMSSWGQQTPVCEKTQLNLPAAAPSCVHMHTHTHTHTHQEQTLWSELTLQPIFLWREVESARVVLGSCGGHWQILADINHGFGLDHHNRAPLSAREDLF